MIYAITTTVIIFILLAVLIKVKRDEDTLTGRLTKLKTHIKHWEGRYESLSKAYEQSVAEIEDLRGTVDTFEKWIEREKDRKAEDVGYVLAVHYKSPDMNPMEVLCRDFKKGTRFETANAIAIVTCRKCLSMHESGKTRRNQTFGAPSAKTHYERIRESANPMGKDGVKQWSRTACGRLIPWREVHGKSRPELQITSDKTKVDCKRCLGRMSQSEELKAMVKEEVVSMNEATPKDVGSVRHYYEVGDPSMRCGMERSYKRTDNWAEVTCKRCRGRMSQPEELKLTEPTEATPLTKDEPDAVVHLHKRKSKHTMCGLKTAKDVKVSANAKAINCPHCIGINKTLNKEA